MKNHDAAARKARVFEAGGTREWGGDLWPGPDLPARPGPRLLIYYS